MLAARRIRIVSGYGPQRPPADCAAAHTAPLPTSSSSSPTRTSSSRASTARCCRRRALQAAAPPGVTVRDLYALYPDYLIDVAAEQAALAAAGSSSGSTRSTGTACRR